MLKPIFKLIKPILSDARSAIVGLVTISLLTSGILILGVKETADFLVNTLQSPTPLWSTILLVVLLIIQIRSKTKHYSPEIHEDKYKDYYFFSPAGAWLHKTLPANRVCSKCKVNGYFSPLALNEKQDLFMCPNCSSEYPNIPREIIAKRKAATLHVPMSKGAKEEEFTFEV